MPVTSILHAERMIMNYICLFAYVDVLGLVNTSINVRLECIFKFWDYYIKEGSS